MPADLVQLTGGAPPDVFADVALRMWLLVLHFKDSDRLVDAVVSAHGIVVIPHEEVRAECCVFGNLHFPVPAQDASRVNFPHIGCLIRLALRSSRQRFIPVMGPITFLNQSDVLE